MELGAIFQPELGHEPLAERQVQAIGLADDIEVALAFELEERQSLGAKTADVSRIPVGATPG